MAFVHSASKTFPPRYIVSSEVSISSMYISNTYMRGHTRLLFFLHTHSCRRCTFHPPNPDTRAFSVHILVAAGNRISVRMNVGPGQIGAINTIRKFEVSRGGNYQRGSPSFARGLPIKIQAEREIYGHQRWDERTFFGREYYCQNCEGGSE